jgi:hypothetical protein
VAGLAELALLGWLAPFGREPGRENRCCAGSIERKKAAASTRAGAAMKLGRRARPGGREKGGVGPHLRGSGGWRRSGVDKDGAVAAGPAARMAMRGGGYACSGLTTWWTRSVAALGRMGYRLVRKGRRRSGAPTAASSGLRPAHGKRAVREKVARAELNEEEGWRWLLTGRQHRKRRPVRERGWSMARHGDATGSSGSAEIEASRKGGEAQLDADEKDSAHRRKRDNSRRCLVRTRRSGGSGSAMAGCS